MAAGARLEAMQKSWKLLERAQDYEYIRTFLVKTASRNIYFYIYGDINTDTSIHGQAKGNDEFSLENACLVIFTSDQCRFLSHSSHPILYVLILTSITKFLPERTELKRWFSGRLKDRVKDTVWMG